MLVPLRRWRSRIQDVIRDVRLMSSDVMEGSKTTVHESPRPFSDIPGPRSLPVVGTLWKYIPGIGEYELDRLHRNGWKKLRRFGPLVREEIVPGVNLVWVFSPEDIETVYRCEGRHPQRRSHLALQKFRKDRPQVYNTGGLLPTNGPDWWRLRSVFQKSLSRPQNVKLYIPVADLVVREFLLRLGNGLDEPVKDFSPELSRLFLELICVVAFDVRLGSLSDAERRSDSRSSRLIDAALTTNSCILATDNGVRLWRWFDTPLYRKLKRGLLYLEEVAVDLVSQKVRMLEERGTEKGNGEDLSLLEIYLSSPELDLKDVIGMAVDMILAGIDTTSNTSAFILNHLGSNQRSQEVLHEEARRLLPSKNSPVTQEVLNESQYTKAVVKESLRLNPISVGIGRILAKDAVLSGYHVPKETVVVTQNQVSCRLPQYFPDPDLFIPERWLKGHCLHRQTSPYLVLPFGHGPRTCIARRLAEQNMYILILRLVREYHVEWLGGDLDARSLLINKPDKEVLLKFVRRKDD